MTQRSKWSERAQRYIAYKQELALAAVQNMVGKAKLCGDVSACVTVSIKGKRRGDIDNYLKTVFDACNG